MAFIQRNDAGAHVINANAAVVPLAGGLATGVMLTRTSDLLQRPSLNAVAERLGSPRAVGFAAIGLGLAQLSPSNRDDKGQVLQMFAGGVAGGALMLGTHLHGGGSLSTLRGANTAFQQAMVGAWAGGGLAILAHGGDVITGS